MASSKAEKESGGPSMRRFKSICVFGEPNSGKDEEFGKAAQELGKVLAARGINLVFGGGIQGLRGCVAINAILKGSKVLGLPVKDLVDKDTTHGVVGTEIKVSSLPERLAYMFRNAEAFIILPGGLETLDGFSNIAYWAKLNFHRKPLGFLNINGFYDGLLSFLNHAVEQEFIPQEIRHIIVSAPTAEQLIDQLQNCAPEPGPREQHVDWQPPESSKKRKPDSPDTTLHL